ncbi:CRE-GLB-18 protein [Aphelenchoides avenae]|nr:CRE-GLB-18 protein [Aphelenchus avenae]
MSTTTNIENESFSRRDGKTRVVTFAPVEKRSRNSVVPTTDAVSEQPRRCSEHLADYVPVVMSLQWELTDSEKTLLRQTWSDDIEFLYALGANIYTYIFENNPQAKELFPSIHRHGENWKTSSEFRHQALNFVKTISRTVENIESVEQVVPYLNDIGKRHVKFADRGFKPSHWDIFENAIAFSLEEHIGSLNGLTLEDKALAIGLWKQLAQFIVTHMKHGYFLHLPPSS